MNLSWPIGQSIDTGISKGTYYDDKNMALHYTIITDVCNLVQNVGSRIMICMRGLKQAYRQFPVVPSD